MKRTFLLCAVLTCATLASASALVDPPPPKELPPAHIHTDDEIETAVVKGILANPEVFAAKLRVEARRGVVALFGSVRDKTAKQTAEKIARSVPGVRAVRNRLIVSPPKR